MLQSLSPENLREIKDSEIINGWLLFKYKGYECGWGIDTDLYYNFDLDQEFDSFEDLIKEISND